MTPATDAFAIPTESIVSGLGSIDVKLEEGASRKCEGDSMQFLAIYENCADYRLAGNGLAMLSRVDHTPSVLTTAELTDAAAVELAMGDQDDASRTWLSAAVAGQYHIGGNCIFVKTDSHVRVFYATTGNRGSMEVWPLTESDLHDYSREMLPRGDHEFLLSCPVGTLRRTHPNWTFVRLK